MAHDASARHPVLVVSADPARRARWVAALARGDLETLETASLATAAHLLRGAGPALAILASDTPELEPAAVAAWREDGVRAPILVVGPATGLARWDGVAGVETLTEPVEDEVLRLRARRRVARAGPALLPLDRGVLDPRLRELRGPDGEVVALTGREVELLLYLAANPGRTLSRDTLLSEVFGWRPGLVTRALDQAVRRLRAKVEADPSRPRHLVTVHGTGYRFEPGTAPAAPPAVAPPPRLGRFGLGRVLGQGSSAVVYRAELLGPVGFRKPVALKVLHRDAPAARFLEEARVGSRLHHPNLVEVYDAGETDGWSWIAMELVDGGSAHALIARGALSIEAAIDLVEPAARGLAHAHALVIDDRPAGLVHCDVKPANLLVGRDGQVKVADFGLASARARATSRPGTAGTAGYAAPEVLAGAEPDARADVYALGVVLAAALTGDPRGGSALHLDDVARERPGLGELLRRMLATSPADRPADAGEVAGSLAALRREAPSVSVGLSGRLSDTFGDPVPAPLPTLSDLGSGRSALRTNVAPPRDAFLGRDRDLDAVRDALDAGARLVTVHGPGGMGKTRLSLHLALERARERPGGAWFADASQATDLHGLLAAVGAALGLATPRDQADPVRAMGLALAARGPILLVLDNLEQVRGAAARVLDEWLARCPEVEFVATSRTRLGVKGERVIPLGPLALDDARAVLRERAAALDPDGSAGSDDELTRLVEALDRLPLALELAAARIRTLGVDGLLRRIDDRFRLLVDPDRPLRHASLEATLDASFELLEPWEQAAFVQLSTFRGGFTAEAFEVVVDLRAFPRAPWAILVLEALIDRSLVHPLPRTDPQRLGLYVQVGAYARQQAERRPALLGEARDRHARWFAAAEVRREDLDDVVAALHTAIATGGPVAALARAAVGLLTRWGPLSRAIDLLDEVRRTALPDAERRGPRRGGSICCGRSAATRRP